MDEYYHIYNRGVMKRAIFIDDRDYSRFLFLILFLQSSAHNFDHITRSISHFGKHRMFDIEAEMVKEISRSREVNLLAFTLQPNHFHLIVRELTEGGMAKYLQRIGNSHTKYFNIKYKQSGHLFQNSYQSVHIEDNEQLLYTSAYIHKHAPKINYEWSSYQDYIKENRWGDLLGTSLVLEQFKNPEEYHQWLKDCPAKETAEFGKHPMLDNSA
ncbi:MAG: transposase [Candidatus Vogelbacteria bacterium]|nr:transposase [Candidatus Vogelbacteria bacterium]